MSRSRLALLLVLLIPGAATAEQFYNCVAIATCRPYDKILSNVPSSRARRALTNRTAFVNSFRAPSAQATEYSAGIPQALMLLNGRLVDDATDLERSDLLVSLAAPFFTDRDRVDFAAGIQRRIPVTNRVGVRDRSHARARQASDHGERTADVDRRPAHREREHVAAAHHGAPARQHTCLESCQALPGIRRLKGQTNLQATPL